MVTHIRKYQRRSIVSQDSNLNHPNGRLSGMKRNWKNR